MSILSKSRLALGSATLALSALLAPVSPVAAEPISYFMPEGITYDQSIPKPENLFRHGLGEKPVRHDQMVSYLTEVANTSDRMTMKTIGYTHEGRPILFFVVSSPENLANIDELQAAHLAKVKGTEPKAGEKRASSESDDANDAESAEGNEETASNDTEEEPLFIWLNYGVHGAESSGMDAVMPALYHFAAAQGDATEKMLDDSVILVTAILNPDGHSRRADHVETFSSNVPVTDPASEVHNLWGKARTNHYWFDLNRQWLLQTQPESRAWVGEWQKWKPQVTTDFHEMGSNASYYFHPGDPERLNPLIPARARTLTKRIADFHRDWMDSESRLYFTEEGFDNFYVGKGSTYPQVNGGLGILFEAGAARGGKIETPAGTRTYADNIRTHFRTTLTTIAGALDQAGEIKAYQQDYFDGALDQAATDDRKAFVMTAKGDQARLRRFVDVMRQHDIDVYKLAEDVTAGGQSFSAGEAYVIPTAQRQYHMVRAVFDQVTEFEKNIFYDVSGWTLPLAYDLDYSSLDAETFKDGLLGKKVGKVKDVVPAKAPAKASYGYVLDWSEYYAPRALYRLLDKGVLVRAAREPFEVRTPDGPKSFDRGDVFVPLIRQDLSEDEIHELMTTIAKEDGVPVTAASSGAASIVSNAVGGRTFGPIEKPSVLLLFDDGLALYDAGEVWHHLDIGMEMPVTLRRKDDLGGLDWSRYTHLVMVGGGNVALDDKDKKRVTQWIKEEGGTVVATRQSALWAQDALLGEAEEDDADEEKKLEPKRLDYADKEVKDAEHLVRGTLVATDLDTSNPIGFGYHDRLLPMHRNIDETLDWPTSNPYAVVSAYAEEDLVLSGYASPRRVREIAGTPAIIAEPMGRGAVVLMADDPVFRATTLGSSKTLMNAIFFSSLIDAPYGEYTVDDTVEEEQDETPEAPEPPATSNGQ